MKNLKNNERIAAEAAKFERLVGGWPTEPDEIKYLISLQYDGEHFCGGSIIGDRHILTAAHCLVDDSDALDNRTIQIVAGTNDLLDEDSKPVVTEVEKVYLPEEYNGTEWTDSIPLGDLAVLKVL